MREAHGPLHGYELEWLHRGHVLIRQCNSRWIVMMWLTHPKRSDYVQDA